jgi:FAD/FMN-containing dehydrogenase
VASLPSPHVLDPARQGYEVAVARLRDDLAALSPDQPVRLSKRTSNLFRDRRSEAAALSVEGLDTVLSVDPVGRTADVGGMTTYEHLVDATLAHGLLPLCVPQLRTITLGGAVTGLGIEAASFRNGCPHESVLELDVLTGDGRLITTSGADDDPHRDLFFGFPNSYGSLGYALRLTIELEPAAPFVALRHVPFATAAQLADAIVDVVEHREYRGGRVDFIDGTVFGRHEQYLTLGTYADAPPPGRATSDYTGRDIYYRSIQQRADDVLTERDFIWRWDTDWFWCSRAFGAQHPVVRRLWPSSKLRSDVYWKLVALDRRTGFSRRLTAARRAPARENVVQDVEVPVGRLAEFLGFFHREVGIEPVWVCPLRQRDPTRRWPLYEFDPDETYVNVGFWSTVPLAPGVDPSAGTVNRRIEQVVSDLGGRKSLYSTSFYARDEFAALYGGLEYEALRREYDPNERLLDLYDKTVRQA